VYRDFTVTRQRLQWFGCYRRQKNRCNVSVKEYSKVLQLPVEYIINSTKTLAKNTQGIYVRPSDVTNLTLYVLKISKQSRERLFSLKCISSSIFLTLSRAHTHFLIQSISRFFCISLFFVVH